MEKYMMKKLLILITAFCLQSIPAHSASFDNLRELSEIARNKGFVRVLVGLDVDVSLSKLGKMSPELKQELAEKKQAILDGLGDTVSTSAQWSSGIGQICIYVTEEGLERLANNHHVKNIMASNIDGMLATYHDTTGTLIKDIEAEIDKKGSAKIEVVLNLENLSYSYLPSGKTLFKISAKQNKENRHRTSIVLDSLQTEHIQNLTNLKRKEKNNPTTKEPVQLLQIDKEGLFAIREHKDIRALRLVDTTKKPPKFDNDAIETAKKTGSAGVLISLYPPFGYSPQIGRLPTKAWHAQTAMLKKTFNDIFSSLGQDAVRDVQEFEGFPNIYAVLSYAALEQLYNNPDPRINRIRLNKGAYGPLLNTSTAFLNMDKAWNHSSGQQRRGQGQQIVIMDSAFEKSHPFLTQTNGQPKITIEACFGTNGEVILPNGQIEKYESLCPNADSITGDSPRLQEGSADSSICASDSDLANLCFHGTHVAGIVAGKYQWNLPNENITLTGMAPEATIIGVSIMSKQVTGPGSPRLWGTRLDLDRAMTGLANVTRAGTQPMTVSLSVGLKSVLGAECPGEDSLFESAVANLYSKNIPVVAATGNSGSRTSILWPACTPKVIKVAGTRFGSDGQEYFWEHSNIVNPAAHPNATFLLAPACVVSSTLNGSHGANCGTSMSAPHVAGLYAIIKQVVPTITVDQATAWILTHASHPVSTLNGYSVQSIQLRP